MFLLAGCQQQTNWYDFGNGLVNLSNTHLISSNASIAAETQPKLEIPPDADEEQQVRYQAHQRYCNDGLKTPLLRGTITEIDQGASRFFDALKKTATVEYLDTCRLRISGNAAIRFDDFTLNLNKYDETLDIHASGMKPAQITEILSKRLTALGQGKSPWNGDYQEVLQHVKPDDKLW